MNYDVYFNDPRYHRLSRDQQRALMRGRITPSEAGMLYLLGLARVWKPAAKAMLEAYAR